MLLLPQQFADGATEAFAKSFFTTILSEIGDKTFFIAAILAMRHSRMIIFLGAAGALIAMTWLSVLMGWAAPNLISKSLTHYAAVALFMYFGGKAVYEFFTKEGEDEYAEAEEELNAIDQAGKGNRKSALTGMLIKAFTLTFLAEWGDRSQITTIGLAASANPYGVGLGGSVAHALCTGGAILGGRTLSRYINERYMHLGGGILFLVFGLHALVSGPDQD